MANERDDLITMTRGQFRRLLNRFATEVETRKGQMSEAEIEKVANRLVEDLSPTCEVSASERLLNSNVSVKIR